MKSVILLCLATLIMSEEVTQDQDVYVMTDSNFKSFIEENEFVFVKFYAPWCGHCKKMAPDYAKLAKKVHDEGNGIKIAKLDATEHKTVAGEHDVQGFPTLKFFINGSSIPYQGARDLDAIYNWIQKKTGPASKALTSDEDYTTHSGLRLSVMYYLPEGDAEALKSYMGFAAGFDDVPFAHSHNDTHAKNHEVTKKYGLVIFRTFDEGHQVL